MKRPEEALQRTITDYMRRCAPKVVWLHIPNQRGGRSKVENMILKACGVRAGTADNVILLPEGRAAWIEVKAGRNKQSEAQLLFQGECELLDHPYCVVRNLDQWIVALRHLGFDVPKLTGAA